MVSTRPALLDRVVLVAVAALLLCAMVNPVQAATEAFTSPRGIYALKVAGTSPGRSQARTYFAVQLLPDPKFVGLVGSVSGDALSLNGVSSYSGLADPERKSYVHVLTGNGRGFVVDIEQFRATDLRCSQNLSEWISAGAQISIRPHPHLADLFGAGNRFGLGSGPDADTADNVVVWDPLTQQERVYFYHSIRGRWEEKDVEADATRAILRFPYGLYIVRRSPGALRISLSGAIGADSLLLPVRTGTNVFSLPVNLSRSLGNLISSSGDFPVVSGPNSNNADLLTFEEPSTGIQFGPFYHSSKANPGGWREVGKGEGAGLSLDLLSTLILRRDGAPGFVFAAGSLVPGPVPVVLPPDPEPGEVPLFGDLPYPQNLPPDLSAEIQISTDLQTWTPHANPTIANGRATFPLPAGQSRGFYRIKVSLPF